MGSDGSPQHYFRPIKGFAFWSDLESSGAIKLRHASHAAAAFARHSGDPRFWRRLAGSGLHSERGGRAQTIDILTLFPDLETTRVQMGDVEFRAENMSPMEVYCLLGIASVRGAKRIFEFGTYDGATTAHLASCSPDVVVWTLDLPAEQGFLQAQAEQMHTSSPETGYRYRDTPCAGRVIQLYGDSSRFDFSPWRSSIDLIVIDGGHSYDIVRSDSASALEMLVPQGILVWDDYSPVWPDVVRAVDDFAKENQLTPTHVHATGLAVLDLASTEPRGARGP